MGCTRATLTRTRRLLKILVVRPGPKYSVEDVANGWVKGLRAVGHEVIDWDLGTRIAFFDEAFRAVVGENDPHLEQILLNATTHLEAACWEYNPDVVLLITGLLVPSIFYEMARKKHFVALIATESPYEDGVQLELAKHCDMVVLNDNKNIHKFGEQTSAHYYGHGYDPEIHHTGRRERSHKSDFCFIGSFYQERIDILEQLNFEGIETVLGGDHRRVKPESPLHKHLLNAIDKTIKNDEVARYYRGTKIGLNIYRKENNYSNDGNACGPREIEMAACGLSLYENTAPNQTAFSGCYPPSIAPQTSTTKSVTGSKTVKNEKNLPHSQQKQFNNVASKISRPHSHKTSTHSYKGQTQWHE